MSLALVNATSDGQNAGPDPDTEIVITIPSTGAGNLIIVLFYNGNVGASKPLVSITGSSETWQNPGKAIWNQGSELIDCWYTKNAVGGDTSYTLNFESSGSGVQWATVYEFSYDHTNGDCVLVDVQSAYSTSNAANPVGQALTLGGATCAVVQAEVGNNDITAIDSSYTYNRPRFGFADAYKLTSDGTAPTWSMSSEGQNTAGLGIAFREATGGGGGGDTWIQSPRPSRRSFLAIPQRAFGRLMPMELVIVTQTDHAIGPSGAILKRAQPKRPPARSQLDASVVSPLVLRSMPLMTPSWPAPRRPRSKQRFDVDDQTNVVIPPPARQLRPPQLRRLPFPAARYGWDATPAPSAPDRMLGAIYASGIYQASITASGTY